MILPRMMSEEQRRCLWAWRRGFQGRDVEGHRRESGRVQAVPRVPFSGGSVVSLGKSQNIGARSDVRPRLCKPRLVQKGRAQNWPGCRFMDRQKPVGKSHPKKSRQGLSKSTSAQPNRGTTAGRALEALICPSPTRNGTRYSFLCEQRLASGPQQMRIVYSLARLWITSAAAGLHVSFPTGSPFLSFWRGDAASFDKPRQLQQSASHSAPGYWRRACPLEQKQKPHMHRFLGGARTGTWEYYSSLRSSWGCSLRGPVRGMVTPMFKRSS